jgi:uncharacterized Rmd1/YagE family protein
MYDLSHSGKSLAEIQTAWHQYYVNLPNDEKHQVWQEFYANYQPASHTQTHHEHLPKATISPTAQKHHAKSLMHAR